jgi:hypothetical protein
MKTESLAELLPQQIDIEMLIAIFKDFDEKTLYMTETGKLYPETVELAKGAIKFSNEVLNLNHGIGYEKKSSVILASIAEQLSNRYNDLKIVLLKSGKGGTK